MSDDKDIYDHLAEMRSYIGARRWSELEEAYERLSGRIAGPHQSARVAALDFRPYEAALQAGLTDAPARLARSDARALYFEYDLDNQWHGTFFLCPEYHAEDVGDDDWACDWVDDWPGPTFKDASDLYVENHFDRTPIAKGTTLYLVARTVSAFGRALDQVPLDTVTVCIAFHDQTPIMRMHEAPVSRPRSGKPR